jgi:membrane protein implicated in regulation of membrane protease activity
MITDRYNFATELMIQVVCFYIGVAIFIGLCMVPPLVLFLPYALPLTFMVCIIVNISFIIRFVKGTNKEIDAVKQKFEKHIDLDAVTFDDVVNQVGDTATEATNNVDVNDIVNANTE